MFNTSNGYSLADIAAATGVNESWGGNSGWWIIILLILFSGGFNGFGNTREEGATRTAIYDGFTTNGIENGIRGIQQGLCDGFYAVNTGMLNGFNGTANAIADLGYATQQGFNASNVALMQAQNGLSTQLANCCCDTRGAIQQANFDTAQGLNALSHQISDRGCDISRQIDGINYNLATSACTIQTAIANNARDIIENQNAGTRAILDYLSQEKISELQNENQALRLAASQQAQNNYLLSELAPKAPIPAYTVPSPFVPYGCC